MKILFATRNQGKLRELRQMLSDTDFDICCLADYPQAPEIEENGATFAENARLKAEGFMRVLGLPTIADDSGLEVDALNGAPGVYSARYAGAGASDAARIDLLLRNLQSVEEAACTARFRCAIALAIPDAATPTYICEGKCEGRILRERHGEFGFGYDPVFFSFDLGCTFAEADGAKKNSVSHRGRAMKIMVEYLRRQIAR